MRKTYLTLVVVAAAAALGAVLALRAAAVPQTSDCVGAAPTGLTSYRSKAADGNCLQGYVWAPPSQPPRAVVVVVHGLHDHARRYAGLAATLNAQGYAVVAQDQRGHGGSGGARQRVDSIEQAMADLALATQQARQRFAQVPVFVYGHSFGGLIVAQQVARQGQGLAGAVISSAALVAPPGTSDGQRRVVSLISSLAPGAGLDAVDETRVVSDPAARAALAADPVLSRDKLPARTIATLLNGVADLQARLGQIQVPVLLLHGLADTITDPAGSQLLQQRAASSVKVLHTYDKALHDLLHEAQAPTVQRDVLAFLNAQVPMK